MLRIALNGYGRIGRALIRALFERELHTQIHVEAINDLGDSGLLAHLTPPPYCLLAGVPRPCRLAPAGSPSAPGAGRRRAPGE